MGIASAKEGEECQKPMLFDYNTAILELIYWSHATSIRGIMPEASASYLILARENRSMHLSYFGLHLLTTEEFA